MIYPGLYGCIIKVGDDVKCLNNASERVDCDQKSRVFLEERIVQPQHGGEESHIVRH